MGMTLQILLIVGSFSIIMGVLIFFRGKCPYCGKRKIKLTDQTKNEIFYQCQACGTRWTEPFDHGLGAG